PVRCKESHRRHHVNGKCKVGLAFLTAVLLLISPAGKCMQAATSTQTHPCCPKNHAPLPEDCTKPGCVYMKPLPIALALSIEGDLRESTTLAVLHIPVVDGVRTMYAPRVSGALSSIQQRFLSLHQLLI